MDERCAPTHLSALVVILSSSVIGLSGSVLQCPDQLTTVVEGVETDGVLTSHSSSFEKGRYEQLNDTYYRVCQCEAMTCLRKCCERTEVMINTTCRDAASNGIQDTIFESRLIPGWTNVRVTYGSGCPFADSVLFYPDDYTNVAYRLLANGSLSVLFDGHDERMLSDFCVDDAYRDKRYAGIVICVRKNPTKGLLGFPLGMALSIPFLAATLVVYSLRELRNIHGKNLSSHVGSLLVAYLSVIVVELARFDLTRSLCMVLGFIRQFAFLSSFFWLSVMCFDVWWSLSTSSRVQNYSRENEWKRFTAYCLYGWGCPIAIVLITAILQFSPTPDNFLRPGIGFPSCFLRDGKPFYAYFYGPVIFVFCADVTLFVLSAARLITAGKRMKTVTTEDKTYMKDTKTRYFLLLKIFLLMGINWIIDPFSWLFEGSLPTWLFIQISITFQAVYIFAVFVCKTEIKKIVRSKFCRGGDNAEISLVDGIAGNLDVRDATDTTMTAC